MSSNNTSAQTSRGADTQSSSIAWSITWSFWWRKILCWMALDVFLVFVVGGALTVGYRQAFSEAYGGIGASDITGFPLITVFGFRVPNFLDLSNIHVSFTNLAGTQSASYNLGLDIFKLWFVFAVVVVWQFVRFCVGIFTSVRRVRKKLRPMNDLALKADVLSNASIMDANNIETLEQAIERASVDSPSVSTGVSDLASVEVALNKLLRQMQEAKLQQMRFVSDASHELRTPISVIQGYVNMLDRWGKDDPEVLNESIDALKEESEHMKELVEQLLFLARGDAGRNTLNKVSTNLAALVAEVEEESAMIDETHTYQLSFDEALGTDAAYQANADVALIKQALRTIVQNAVKYSEAGTIIKFGVGPAEDSNTVSCFIQDEGEGMTADEVSHIFERFWRSDSARGSNKDGSGLGMSIAKWIMDAHGGSIDVVSSKGVGTRFTMNLPK